MSTEPNPAQKAGYKINDVTYDWLCRLCIRLDLSPEAVKKMRERVSAPALNWMRIESRMANNYTKMPSYMQDDLGSWESLLERFRR